MDGRIKKYLEETPYCGSDSQLIKKKANKITIESNGKKGNIKKIYRWVRDNVKWEILPVVGAEKTLKRKPKEGICTDKVNLFVALCRALSVPARYMLLEAKLKFEEKSIWAPHAASEVYLDNEWAIADPTFGAGNEDLIPKNKFGEKSWIEAKDIRRRAGLSRFFVWFNNIFIKLSPTGRRMKEILDRSKK